MTVLADVLPTGDTASGAGADGGLARRLRAVPPPRPVLDRHRAAALTGRQREVLDHLGVLFDGGFAHLTMAEIAARAGCSLRTLYSVAPSRDELVLVVVDRNLWRVGRTAMAAIGTDMGPLDAVQAYLTAAAGAVEGISPDFAADLAGVPAARRLAADHEEYTERVTRSLLEAAVEEGSVAPLDTVAAARILASIAFHLSRPDVQPTLRSTPREATGELVGLVVAGMRAGAGR